MTVIEFIVTFSTLILDVLVILQIRALSNYNNTLYATLNGKRELNNYGQFIVGYALVASVLVMLYWLYALIAFFL